MSVKAKVVEEARRQSEETGRTLLAPSMAVEEFDLIVEDATRLFVSLRERFGLKPVGRAFSALIYDKQEIEEALKKAGYLPS